MGEKIIAFACLVENHKKANKILDKLIELLKGRFKGVEKNFKGSVLEKVGIEGGSLLCEYGGGRLRIVIQFCASEPEVRTVRPIGLKAYNDFKLPKDEGEGIIQMVLNAIGRAGV